jgi:hypothetical protein
MRSSVGLRSRRVVESLACHAMPSHNSPGFDPSFPDAVESERRQEAVFNTVHKKNSASKNFFIHVPFQTRKMFINDDVN